jgi:hypothetical protein
MAQAPQERMPPNRLSSAHRPPNVVIVAASTLIALVLASASVSSISLLPPKLEPRDYRTAGATTHVLIDLDRSRITDRRALWNHFDMLETRADALAQLMASAPVVQYIGRSAHVRPHQIAAVAPVTATALEVLRDSGSEQRAREILLANEPYRLEIQSRPHGPVLDIYSQAPSVTEAERLADASIEGLREYLRALAIRKDADADVPLHLNQLGRARGAELTPHTGLKVAALTFLLAFAVVYGTLRGLVAIRLGRGRGSQGIRTSWSRGGATQRGDTATAAAHMQAGVASVPPATPLPVSGGAVALPPLPIGLGLAGIATREGNWPRTTRVLPWMLASFMAILWLVPFDSIQLNVSSPVDLKLDRLVLPIIAVTWMLCLAIGGRGAPRFRLTWIHGAVGAFVAIACLSVILDAGTLNRALEFDIAFKKLPLLIAYLSLFVMMASVVRREEVGPLLKYTLLLAVICGVGILWESRSLYNVFFEWSDKLLPGPFEVATTDSGWGGGRRATHGPGGHGLVAVSMMSMALPIAVLGVIQAERLRGRVVYGLAACVLIAASLATQRKTGVLAPVAGVLALAYFRRRELLRLAPVALVLLAALMVVSPAILVPVLDQFKPDRLETNTVLDRASDYDAIRPDVWSHFAFGRGYGSYQPLGHQILDSEVLVRLVETGVVGLVAFIMLGVSVVASARAMISSRHPIWAPSALAGAAAAVVFLVLATLFDTLAYPQVPYIFLCFAALVASLVRPPEGEKLSSGRGGPFEA